VTSSALSDGGIEEIVADQRSRQWRPLVRECLRVGPGDYN